MLINRQQREIVNRTGGLIVGHSAASTPTLAQLGPI